MYHSATTMSSTFEAEKNQKAFIYTSVICGALVLIALISWKIPAPPVPPTEDLIEVNLGNFEEGMGDVQPLIKGEKAPDQESAPPQQATAATTPPQEQQADDNNDEDAAPINKTEKPVTKSTTETPKVQSVVTKPTAVVTPTPKPQKPKIAGYNGPANGTGNGATEDNGYKYQGNNPNGRGDNGNPNGNPDSYGKNPGGKVGGLHVSKGDRTIINNYIFSGDFDKATINAIIKVSPDGVGTYVGRDKGSTSTDSKYTNAIIRYLPNVKFNKADHESIVTVPFNFTVTN
jgi:hypothetical protein